MFINVNGSRTRINIHQIAYLTCSVSMFNQVGGPTIEIYLITIKDPIVYRFRTDSDRDQEYDRICKLLDGLT